MLGDKEHPGLARHRTKPDRVLELQFFGHEPLQSDRLRQRLNHSWHPVLDHRRGLRLLETHEILDQVREFRRRQTGLQSVRHQRHLARVLRPDVRSDDAHRLRVGAHQLNPLAGHLLENSRVLLARLRLHCRGAVPGRNRRRRRQHCLDDLAPPELVPDPKQIRPRHAAVAVLAVASRAGESLCVGEKRLAPERVAFVRESGVEILLLAPHSRRSGVRLARRESAGRFGRALTGTRQCPKAGPWKRERAKMPRVHDKLHSRRSGFDATPEQLLR